ncbi:MAG: response regulator transcription factor [Acidimicrobiales bacterium]|nr:response regulator transcription factor [Acidimicrobiales bacterium]
MTDPIRVLVVDDHVIVRSGLEQLLETVDSMKLVGFAADGRQAITAVEELQPDVVLMDLSMPVMDGVEATGAIKHRWPAVKIVVLTSFSEQQRVLAALEAGADGYVLKHADPDQILAAIQAAYAGGAPIDPKVARVLIEAKKVGSSGRAALTDREVEVLQLVGQGLANKLIARRLGISERTVKAHLTKIFQSLGVTDRTQAALWAAQHLDR